MRYTRLTPGRGLLGSATLAAAAVVVAGSTGRILCRPARA